MGEYRFVVVFGESELTEGVLSVTTEPAGPAGEGVASADVRISSSVVASATIDYRSEVRIFAIIELERKILFTGIVDQVIPGEVSTQFKLVTILQVLDESRIAGLGVGVGTGLLEIAWSLLRTSGIAASKISIEGFGPGPLEVFEVAAALDGIELDEPLILGEVRLLPAGPVSRLAGKLGPDELRETYASASAWALTVQNALTLVEAEAKGLRVIDVALAWLMARTHFSSPVLPLGYLRRYQRSWARSRLSRRDVVVVRGVATGRHWLRVPTELPDQASLHLPDIGDLAAMPLPQDLPIEVREALMAWRRAAEDTDLLAGVVAMWEAIEFFATAAEAPKLKMFSKSERKDIRIRATEGLQGEKLQRVKQVLDMLNNPSLMMNLRLALKEDGVPYTEDEFALLVKVRDTRNKFVHGKSPDVPSQDDVRRAIALVNRMLVYRVYRLINPTVERTEEGVIIDSIVSRLEDGWK